METSPPCGRGRWIDLSRDLEPIADLLAVAFADHLDEDGYAALRQLRRIAHNRRAQRWYSQHEVPGAPVYGFVWECEGRIVGNVSLIPLPVHPKQYLIVNVAVLPAYRRRGIARALMQQSLAYVRRQGAQHAWLQVETWNQGAIALYRSLGFSAKDTVTIWQAEPWQASPKRPAAPGLQVKPGWVRRSEWPQELDWLKSTYLPERQWHLPCRRWATLSPTWRGRFLRLIQSPPLHQWLIRRNGQFLGAAVWIPHPDNATDALLLAAPPRLPPGDLAALLTPIRRHARHPLRAELPQGFLAESLALAGFAPKRHLLWMKWTS